MAARIQAVHRGRRDRRQLRKATGRESKLCTAAVERRLGERRQRSKSNPSSGAPDQDERYRQAGRRRHTQEYDETSLLNEKWPHEYKQFIVAGKGGD